MIFVDCNNKISELIYSNKEKLITGMWALWLYLDRNTMGSINTWNNLHFILNELQL